MVGFALRNLEIYPVACIQEDGLSRVMAQVESFDEADPL
jgi:hypothetical protein